MARRTLREKQDERLRFLFQIVVDEQHRYLDRLQTRVSLYTGLLVSLISGSIAAVFTVPFLLNFFFASIGGLLVALVAILAMRGVFRTYRLFTECISTRAKLEHDLRLDVPRRHAPVKRPGDWLACEPYVAFRHLRNRRTPWGGDYRSSEDYELAMQENWKNFLGITNVVFIATLAIGLALLAAGIYILRLHGPDVLPQLMRVAGVQSSPP